MELLSILSVYNYDNTIFDGMKLPEGVDRDTVIGNICVEMAELELLYSKPEVLKYNITIWSDKNQWTWQKLYESTRYDYNPINNYDMEESAKRKNTADGTQKSTQTNNLIVNSDNLHRVSAFNTQTLQDADKDIGTVRNGGTVDNNIHSQSSNDETTTLHRSGNIGVTTTQQMIEQERKVSEFNIYDYIVDSFKHRFCVMVW